ncbi:MarR family winged helix-turn-helix transcriptional regulator [Pseudonocardia sp. RS010]|uniref:MarR family winged helix-turn-helix transcriptional regulator n=1 Tax=Pseudonocardia sp. RS010 TaxID=3385979 RepID=UPI0039A1ABC7
MSTAPPSVTGTGLLDALAAAAHRVERRIEAALGPDGPGLDRWRVLDLLAAGDGHPMSGIAAAVRVPAPTLTKIIDRLIDQGLVYRRVDETDRRRVLVLLADRGRELHARLAPAVREVETALLQELGPAAADLRQHLGRLAR